MHSYERGGLSSGSPSWPDFYGGRTVCWPRCMSFSRDSGGEPLVPPPALSPRPSLGPSHSHAQRFAGSRTVRDARLQLPLPAIAMTDRHLRHPPRLGLPQLEARAREPEPLALDAYDWSKLLL
jgi:hypothetical protein